MENIIKASCIVLVSLLLTTAVVIIETGRHQEVCTADFCIGG